MLVVYMQNTMTTKIEASLTKEVEDRVQALTQALGCSRASLVVQGINELALKYYCFHLLDIKDQS